MFRKSKIVFPILLLLLFITIVCAIIFGAVSISFAEMAGAIRKSAVVTGVSMIAPTAIYLTVGHISVFGAIGIGVLAGVGWLFGLRLTAHPLLDEIHALVDAGLQIPTVQRRLAALRY